MPVRELVRGLAGAICALLATFILMRYLAEDGRSASYAGRGIWWLPFRSFGEASPQFGPILPPMLVFGAPCAVLGVVLAFKLTTKRSVLYALAGAVVAVGLSELFQRPAPERFGRAGENTIVLIDLFAALAGGCAGAAVAERSGSRRDRDRREPRVW